MYTFELRINECHLELDGLRHLESFRNRLRPQYDVATLKTLAEGLNQAICSHLQSVDDNDVVNQTTLEELEKGYIWQDDSPEASSRSVLAKRFGLVPKDKIRMIKDCPIGGLNKTIGVVEKYRIHSIDEISAMLAWMLDFQAKRGKLPYWILGRTFALKAAYKQYGLNESDRVLRLAVRDTDSHAIKYFGLNSLRFGPVGSVGGFLRISMALWFLGLKSLSLAWTADFDDYTVFCAEPLCRNTDQTVAAFFDLLRLVSVAQTKGQKQFNSRFR